VASKLEVKMRKIIYDRLDIARTGVLIAVLLGVSGIALLGSPRIGYGLTRGNATLARSAPSVSLTPDNLDFGNQVVKRTSPAKRVIVKNTGVEPLYIDSVDLGGDNPTAFAILKDTCTGATVDPARACIVDVTFTPSVTGGRNARLKLSNNSLDSPQRLKLKGNGINAIDVAPF
jgi:hypothetical protein